MSTVATTRAKLPAMSDAALAWTIADLQEVIRIQETFGPAGYRAPKLGDYIDELHECLAERNRRVGALRCRCCGRPL